MCMKVSFKNYQTLESIDTNVLVQVLSEEYVAEYLKVNGKCVCGPDCKCGEVCKCEKTPLQEAIYEVDFKGKTLEMATVSSQCNNFDKIIYVGLGKTEKLTNVVAEKIGYKVFKHLKKEKVKYATIAFNITTNKAKEFDYTEENTDLYSSFVLGFSLSEYEFTKYLTGEKLKKKENVLKEAIFITNKVKDLEKTYKDNEIVKECVFYCKDLVNEPANVIYPESYVKIAKEVEKLGVEVEVLDKKQMQKLGMHALLSVNQGSDNDPYLVILKYNGGKKGDKPLAFVGKGVTFDSGGLSLKPSSAMEDMKIDMAGSAVVLSLIKLLAMRKAKVNTIGVMALVENMPSGHATKVGDIVKSMSGQTIEITNTDAEGRVILADALYYTATKYEPELIIDLATLTGAIMVALGDDYAGLFTNNSELFKQLKEAGENTEEKVWRMPLSEIGGFYDKQMDSDFADIKNAEKGRYGASITAAQFLQRFINKHPKWAHIDIASTAYVAKEHYLTPKNATGYGVRLLNELVKKNYEK